MDDLLTARQVQDILQVDRITVYRMLQDGRLKATKIGQQWRFPRREVERLISGEARPAELTPSAAESNLPIHCIQTIQGLFSDVSQLGGMVLDMQGAPLTRPSRQCRFCTLVQATESGQQACQASWRSFIQRSQAGETHFTCPCGVDFTGAPIKEYGSQVGLFLIGGFNWQSPEPAELQQRIQQLAADHQLSEAQLTEAARSIPVVPASQHSQVETWAPAAVNAIQSILQERTGFLDRLQQIASLTQIP